MRDQDKLIAFTIFFILATLIGAYLNAGQQRNELRANNGAEAPMDHSER